MPYKKDRIMKLIGFSPAEWSVVCQKAEAVGQRTGTYIKKIAVQGEIKKYDMKELNNLRISFNKIGIELNQIARVANSTNSVYAKDIEDMQKQMKYFKGVIENYLSELKTNEIL